MRVPRISAEPPLLLPIGWVLIVGMSLAIAVDVATIRENSSEATQVSLNRTGSQGANGPDQSSGTRGFDGMRALFGLSERLCESRLLRGARWRRFSLGCVAAVLGTAWTSTALAEVGVCVDVQQKSWADDTAGSPSSPAKRAKPDRLSLEDPSLRSGWRPQRLSAKEGDEPETADGGSPFMGEQSQSTTTFETPTGATSVSGQSDAPGAIGPTKASLETTESAGGPNETSEPSPEGYLRRMIEYEVTHKPGFEAVATGCSQRISVELYPIRGGYTVFARYTGYGREERVNAVSMQEFPQLAGRIVKALLEDRPISETVSRQDVLRADSEGRLRKVDVQGHALFALGTTFRTTKLPTAPEGDGPATRDYRWLTPASIRLGYRGKFQAWGLDAFGILELGTEEMSVRQNPSGGHVDYAGSGGLGLHFLRYFSQDDVTSLYVGGGATFTMSFYQQIREPKRRNGDSRDLVTGTGLELDALVGYEFMRASALHFFAQGGLRLPTYLVRFEHNEALTNSYTPGLMAEIGMVF